MIYGNRIKQVRELKGWTQTELAHQFGVTQAFIAQIENGWSKVPDEFLKGFAFRSGFHSAFFEAPRETEFPLGSLLFRARASMTEREQKSVRTHASMAHEVLHRMLVGRSVRDVPLSIPHSPGDPERAAIVTRSELGIPPDQPVRHVLHAMESSGVMTLALPRAFDGGDAFCVWTLDPTGKRRPFVVLSADRAADRVRYSAAHELGHLVMHQPMPASVDLDGEANWFAGAFLMPADAMKQEVPNTTTLETFLQIKVRWGVSVQAAIVRARNLELITQQKYKALFQRLSARGWRMHEPLTEQIPLERPRAFRQIAELIYGTTRLNFGKIAGDVNYPESFVRDLFEAHASRASEPQSHVAAPDNAAEVKTPLVFRAKARKGTTSS